MSAYLVFDIEVHDEAVYANYVLNAPELVERFGGRYLVRGGAVHPLEGGWTPSRLVIVEFESLQAAQAFYGSDDYRKIVDTRIRSTHSRGLIVAGV